jgi:quinoprotein glucose dehydrogenase
LFDPAADKAAEETAKILNEGFGKRGAEELVKLLAHTDQRVRLGAQFELVKRGEAAPLVQAALGTNPKLMRLHGIWGVAQLARGKAVAASGLKALGADSDPEIRAQWAKVAGEMKLAGEVDHLIQMLADAEPRVRFFAAQALGRIGAPSAADALVRLASETGAAEAHLRDAVATALTHTAPPKALAALAKDPSINTRACALLALGKMRSPEAYIFLDDATPFIAENAARIIYENRLFMKENGSICRLAYFGINKDISPAFEARAVNSGLLYGSPSMTKRFVELAEDTKLPERKRVVVLNALRDWNTPILRDPVLGIAWRQTNGRGDASVELGRIAPRLLRDASPAVRTAAAEAAGVLKLAKTDEVLQGLVSDTTNSGELRATALRALGAMESPKLKEAVLSALGDSDKKLLEAARKLAEKTSPGVAVKVNAAVLGKGGIREQQEALAVIARQPVAEADAVIIQQLDAVNAGNAPKGIWLDIFEAAAKRTDAAVKTKLAAYEQSRKAGDPLSAWTECLTGGDGKLGKEIFFEKAEAGCLRCHKVKGEGGDVGPDLFGIAKQHDRDYLLRSIVEPNAVIAPGFENVMVTMTDGSVVAGILSGEDASTVTLKSLVDGKPQKIQKAKIRERTGVPSAMPPGLGDVLGKRGLRDVIEYLAGLK